MGVHGGVWHAAPVCSGACWVSTIQSELVALGAQALLWHPLTGGHTLGRRCKGPPRRGCSTYSRLRAMPPTPWAMAPRWSQDGSKRAQGGQKMAPRWAQEAAQWLKMAARCPQDGPKRPQVGPKKAPRWPQEAPRCPKMLKDAPKMAPRWPQEATRGPNMAPRWPQEAPRWRQDGPKNHQIT